MSHFWDDRFSSATYAYGTAPHSFLVDQVRYFKPGMRALAVADGEGRNGVWLAQRGMEVVSVDFSHVGLEKARRLSVEKGVNLTLIHADLLHWQWPAEAFDLVASVFIHFGPGDRERMHDAMKKALKPGGLLVLTAFTPKQLFYKTGGPPQEELLYTAAELRADMTGMNILTLTESVLDLDEGEFHRGTASVVQLVAEKRPDT